MKFLEIPPTSINIPLSFLAVVKENQITSENWVVALIVGYFFL